MRSPPRDPILLVLRRWYVIITAAVLGLAVGAAYYLYGTHYYEARVSVIPGLGAVASGGDQFAAAAKLLDLDPADILGSTTTGRIAAMLMSRSVADEVIGKLDLMNHYGATYIEQARSLLGTRCHTNVDLKADVVELTCRDKDPEMAQALVTKIAAFGGQVSQRISSSSAAEARRFLESEVQEARARADAAARALREFQEKHHVIEAESQAKAVVASIVTLHAQRIDKQIELAYQESFASPTEARSTQLRHQLDALDQELTKLVGTVPADGHAGATAFPPAMEIPALAAELRELVREQKVRETILLALSQRLEIARGNEARAAATFDILDSPMRPTYRVWPTLQVLPLGTAVGVVAGLLLVLVPAWWRGLLARIVAEEARRTSRL